MSDNKAVPDVDPFAGELDEVPKPVMPSNIKSIDERAADWMKKADTQANNGAANVFPIIAGMQMKSFSMARASFLRKLDNPFVSGVMFKDIEDPFLAVGEFLFVCSASLPEVIKVIKDKDVLEAKALCIIDDINAQNVGEVMDAIVDYTTSEMGSRVDAESKTESKDDEPGN